MCNTIINPCVESNFHLNNFYFKENADSGGYQWIKTASTTNLDLCSMKQDKTKNSQRKHSKHIISKEEKGSSLAKLLQKQKHVVM